MLANTVVLQIERLLATTCLSQRQIAVRVGVSRVTVNQIARGRRKAAASVNDEEPTPLWSGPYVRCPGCGGRVQMPCLLCAIRRDEISETPEPKDGRSCRERDLERLPSPEEIALFYAEQQALRATAYAEDLAAAAEREAARFNDRELEQAWHE